MIPIWNRFCSDCRHTTSTPVLFVIVACIRFFFGSDGRHETSTSVLSILLLVVVEVSLLAIAAMRPAPLLCWPFMLVEDLALAAKKTITPVVFVIIARKKSFHWQQLPP